MSARLDAINSCLAGLGLSSIASEDDTDLDAAQAMETLDRVARDTQARGWWFNRETGWKLSPDEETGYISLPSDTMHLEATGESYLRNLTMRQGKVYDMVNHTYDFRDSVEDDGYLYLTLIREISFEDLPPIVASAITKRARRLFAQDSEVDSTRWNFQIRDDERAWGDLEVAEARSRKGNYFRDNPTAASNLAMIGGPNSRTTSFTYSGKRGTTYIT